MGTVSNRPFAVVTGASSGIGLELARQCLEHGFDVLIASDEPSIHEVAGQLADGGGRVQAHQCDLATYDGVEALHGAIREAGRPVDALILNAGVGVGGAFVDTALDDELRMIALNCASVVHLAKHVVRDMVAVGRGRVLITSSIVATVPSPGQAVYAATKAFDHVFAEGIRHELKEAGITVTALRPNATDTEFFARAGLEDTRVGQADKDDPAEVARHGFDAMMRGDDAITAGGIANRAAAAAAEILPEPAKAAMASKLTEPAKKP